MKLIGSSEGGYYAVYLGKKYRLQVSGFLEKDIDMTFTIT